MSASTNRFGRSTVSTGMRHSRLKFAALPLTLVALAACTTPSEPSTTGSVAATSAPATSAPAVTTTTQTPTPTAETTTQTPTPTQATAAPTTTMATPTATKPTPVPAQALCGHTNTKVIIAARGAAAGSVYLTFKATNIGTATCTTRGYPGVQFVTTGAGRLVGAEATRDTTAPVTTIRLTPGQSTTFSLKVANAGNYDPATCRPDTADEFRVYLPEERTAVGVQSSVMSTCANPNLRLLTVRPMGSTNG